MHIWGRLFIVHWGVVERSVVICSVATATTATANSTNMNTKWNGSKHEQ